MPDTASAMPSLTFGTTALDSGIDSPSRQVPIRHSGGHYQSEAGVARTVRIVADDRASRTQAALPTETGPAKISGTND
jgi:hypothetical protein